MNPRSVTAFDDDVRSPCNSVCKVDREGICVGCWRSIDEIVQWSSMSPDEKRATLARSIVRQSKQ